MGDLRKNANEANVITSSIFNNISEESTEITFADKYGSKFRETPVLIDLEQTAQKYNANAVMDSLYLSNKYETMSRLFAKKEELDKVSTNSDSLANTDLPKDDKTVQLPSPTHKIKTVISKSPKKVKNKSKNGELSNQSNLHSFLDLKLQKSDDIVIPIVTDLILPITVTDVIIPIVNENNDSLSPFKDRDSSDNDNSCIIRVSTSLFGTPKRDKAKVSKVKELKEKKRKKHKKMKDNDCNVEKDQLENENNIENQIKANNLEISSNKTLIFDTEDKPKDTIRKSDEFIKKKVRFSDELTRSYSPEVKFKKRSDSCKDFSEIQSPNSLEKSTSNTNAFALMMDSRNKVIGRNSPGKDLEDVAAIEEDCCNKGKTVARKLMLQEWSNIKGGTKRKLDEADKECYISETMEIRAKRLKKLLKCDEGLVGGEGSKENTEKLKKVVTKSKIKENLIKTKAGVVKIDKTKEEPRVKRAYNKKKVSVEGNTKNGSKKFKTERKSNKSVNSDQITVKTDEISKIDAISGETIEELPCHLVISPEKKNLRKHNSRIQLSLKRKDCIVADNVLLDQSVVIVEETNDKKIDADNDNIKNDNDNVKNDKSNVQNDKSNVKNDKSNVKNDKAKVKSDNTKLKVIKNDNINIRDDVEVIVNDDSVMPTVRRRGRPKKSIIVVKETTEDDLVVIEDKIVKKNKKSDKKVEKSNGKVASVFLKATPRPKVDPAVLEARRAFLHSSAPMKKVEKKIENAVIEYDLFPKISHIQQKTDSPFWNLPPITNSLTKLTEITQTLPTNNRFELGTFTQSSLFPQITHQLALHKPQRVPNKKAILLHLKETHSDYPVYKSYKLLKKKYNCGANNTSNSNNCKTALNFTKKLIDDSISTIVCSDSDHSIHSNNNEANTTSHNHNNNNNNATMWTEKYKPTCAEDIVGNRASAASLVKYLRGWLEFSGVDGASGSGSWLGRKKKRCARRGSESDFITSDDDGDGDSSKRRDLPSSAIVLRGAHGTGKTSTVYAVCKELDINVLELNASSKRTGKILLQKLQEATQSQQIHQSSSQPPTDDTNSQSSTNSSSSSSRMCLLLIEDIDVVFEQDDGFLASLTALLAVTKRPVVMTLTETVAGVAVQRLLRQYPVVTYRQLSGVTCGLWLQLVCLIEGVEVKRDKVLGELLQYNNGDLRRTLLQLQYWTQTGGQSHVKPQPTTRPSLNLLNTIQRLRQLSTEQPYEISETSDDLNLSEISEICETTLEIKSQSASHDKCIDSFVKVPNFTSLGILWWNTSNLLQSGKTSNENKLLGKDLVDFYEIMSFVDCQQRVFSFGEELEPSFRNYERSLRNSLSLDHEEDCGSDERDFAKEYSGFLLDESYKRVIRDSGENGTRFDMGVPVSHERRWRIKEHRCQETFSEALPLSTSLDRRSFATDYYPTLITIAKSEQSRSVSNQKRGSRFYNYLRSIGVKCTESVLMTACNSYQKEENNKHL